MRPEDNPLDLNNFPEDFSRDGKQVLEEISPSGAGSIKKKSGAKDGIDESGKVYECRFCSLKFCKSQALGGHMNRHRQERETEQLNRARQLVFSNDTFGPQGAPPHFGYHPGDPAAYRAMYPPRLFSGSQSTPVPPPPPPPQPLQTPYLYPSTSSRPNQYLPQHPMNEYYLGHVLGGNGGNGGTANTTQQFPHTYTPDSNYTCIGAPVGHGGFPPTGSGRGGSDNVAPGSSLGGRFQDHGL